MSKRRVDKWIPVAYEALTKTGIAENGKVNGKFQSQIATFGAAVVMGSLRAATAFFAQQGSAAVQREKLLQAMYYIITKENGAPELVTPKEVVHYVCNHESSSTREMFIDAAVALKLAMNLFDMGKGDKNEESKPAVQ